jgi:hypothetical protein
MPSAAHGAIDAADNAPSPPASIGAVRQQVPPVSRLLGPMLCMLLALTGFGGTSPPAAVATQPLYVSACGTPVQRPHRIVLACADGNFYLSGLRYTGWNSPVADGSGLAYVNDCEPVCAGGRIHRYRVRITLSTPTGCPSLSRMVMRGGRFYNTLTIVATGTRPRFIERREVVRNLSCAPPPAAIRVVGVDRIGGFRPAVGQGTVAHALRALGAPSGRARIPVGGYGDCALRWRSRGLVMSFYSLGIPEGRAIGGRCYTDLKFAYARISGPWVTDRGLRRGDPVERAFDRYPRASWTGIESRWSVGRSRKGSRARSGDAARSTPS